MRAGDLFPLSNEYPGLAWINACACACSVYVVLTAGEGALPCMAAQERQPSHPCHNTVEPTI